MASLSKSSVGMICGWSESAVGSEANVLSESDGIISVLHSSLTLDRGPRLTTCNSTEYYTIRIIQYRSF